MSSGSYIYGKKYPFKILSCRHCLKIKMEIVYHKRVCRQSARNGILPSYELSESNKVKVEMARATDYRYNGLQSAIEELDNVLTAILHQGQTASQCGTPWDNRLEIE